MEFDQLKRRAFITFMGGAAVWPLAVSAQQSPLPTVGFLSSLARNDAGHVMPAFQDGLNGAGLVEGRSVAIEYRWAAGEYQRLPALAADLVERRVAAIAAISGTPAALAAKAATTTIPIVFAIGGDPVAPGLVPSLNRPGGNVTGASFYTAPLVSKRLDLARELVPGGSTIAVLINPDNPGSVPEGMAAETSAAAVGQPLLVLGASTRDQIDDAFAAIKQQRVGALLVASDPFFFSERVKLVVQMARHAVHLRRSRAGRGRRPHQLWREPRRGLSPSWQLRRPHRARRKAGRPAGDAAGQIPSGDQSQDREIPRH